MTKIGMNHLDVTHANREVNQRIGNQNQIKESKDRDNSDVGIKMDLSKKIQEPSLKEAESVEAKSQGNGRIRGFFSSVRESVVAAADTVRNIGETAVTIAKDVAGTVKETASNIAVNISETASNVRGHLSEASGSVARLSSAAAGMVGDATAMVSAGVKTAVSIGRDVVQSGANLAEGLRQMGEAFGKDQSLSERAGHLARGTQTMANAFEPLSSIPEGFQRGREEISNRMDSIKSQYQMVKEEAAAMKSTAISIGQEVAQSVSYTTGQIAQGTQNIIGAFSDNSQELVYA
ncbi:hypothetical protein SAMN05192551_102261 [Tindallia magadiensis]|uniref:Uncharacterized protein n=1 Tax=Tindallia magadiensis TaxID=69895 RepID=A0A1I3C7R2_9FIRM|nr:hypothetical protein [Tindallia magadiensis]SFH70443.1 hypothetical protein SAMN05192551_102261 [Tindallia magadiensis]